MVKRTLWLDRKFNFNFPVSDFPFIIERLRGTPDRAEALVKRLPAGILTKKPERGWSIQEQIGHLIKVEALHIGRLDDYDAGLESLRAADVKNVRTTNADFNAESIEWILTEFRKVREAFIDRLEAMDEARAARSAHHPRLDVPMRVCDMALFAAEHDDYHFAMITELERKFEG
ncbi:MAG: DinB family protein [Candidatus Zixiibacteriota bacterium]